MSAEELKTKIRRVGEEAWKGGQLPFLPRRVRHKVMQVAVVTALPLAHGGSAGHNPVFCYRYSTEVCVTRQTIPWGAGGVRSGPARASGYPTHQSSS